LVVVEGRWELGWKPGNPPMSRRDSLVVVEGQIEVFGGGMEVVVGGRE
jgi:hypothetical protein